MAKCILKTDQTETPDADILGRDWYGDYQLHCSVYGSNVVKVQTRVPGGTWNNAKFEGNDFELTAAGDSTKIEITRRIDWRVWTAAQGAEVWIDKVDPHA